MSRKAIIIGGLAAGLAVGGYGVADTYAGRGYRPEGAAKDELVRKAVEGQALLDSRAARRELARLDALVEAKQQQLYGCSRSWPEYAQVESELASLRGRREVVDRDLAAEQAKMGVNLRASEALSADMPAGVGDRFGAAQEERARFDAAMYPQAFSDVRFGPRPAHALGWAAGAAGTAVAVAGLVAVAGRRRKPETEGSDEDVFSKDLSDGQDAQDVEAAQAAVTKAEADRLQAEIDAAKAEADRVRAERDSLRKLVDEAPKPSPSQEAELREILAEKDVRLAEKEKALAEREKAVADLNEKTDDLLSAVRTHEREFVRLTDENAKLREAVEKAAKEASKAPAAPAPVESDPDLADLVSGAPDAAKGAEADGIVPPAEEAASPAAVMPTTASQSTDARATEPELLNGPDVTAHGRNGLRESLLDQFGRIPKDRALQLPAYGGRMLVWSDADGQVFWELDPQTQADAYVLVDKAPKTAGIRIFPKVPLSREGAENIAAYTARVIKTDAHARQETAKIVARIEDFYARTWATEKPLGDSFLLAQYMYVEFAFRGKRAMATNGPQAEPTLAPQTPAAATEIRPAAPTPTDEKLESVVAAVDDAMKRQAEAAEATQTTPEPMSVPAAAAPQAPAASEMKPNTDAEMIAGPDRSAAKTQAWPQPASPAEPATLAIPSASAERNAASGAETTMAADAAQLPADAVSPQSAKAAIPEKVGLFASIKAFFSFGKKKGTATAAQPAAPAAPADALPPLPPEPASEPITEAAQPAAPAATITPEPADDDDSADFGNVRGSRSKMPVIDLSALEEQVDASGEASIAPAGKSGLAADPQAAQLGLPPGFIVAPKPAPAATPVTQAPEAAPAARDEIDANVRAKTLGLFMEAAGLVPAGKHLRIPLRSKTLPAAGAQQAIGVLRIWKAQENGRAVTMIVRTLDGTSIDYALEDGVPAETANAKIMDEHMAKWAVGEIEKSCKIPSPHLSGKALVGQFEMIKGAVTRG